MLIFLVLSLAWPLAAAKTFKASDHSRKIKTAELLAQFLAATKQCNDRENLNAEVQSSQRFAEKNS